MAAKMVTEKARIPKEPVVPTTFSALSPISEISTYENREGVVFDNLEQLEAALRAFGIGAMIATSPSRKLRSIATATDPNSAVIDRINTLHRDDKVHRLPGRYSLIGTSFSSQTEEDRTRALEGARRVADKTGLSINAFLSQLDPLPDSAIRIVQVDGKYVLKLRLRPEKYSVTEKSMADAVSTHLALTEASLVVTYTPVDQLWFNIDLEQYAQVLGIGQSDIRRVVTKISHPDSWMVRVKLGVENKFGVKTLSMDLTSTDMHYEWTGHQILELVDADGTRIFGASDWSSSRQQGYATAKPQQIQLTMELPKDFPEGAGREDRALVDWLDDMVTSKEKIEGALSRRDSLATVLRETLIQP